jgi:2,4'-dihydroxyacetophenone dioxygenase
MAAPGPIHEFERTDMNPLQTAGDGPHATLLACDPQHLPWAPWAMKGAAFKLLGADLDSGRFSLLIRLDKGCHAPAHRHVGAVEGIVLEGGFHYADEPQRRFTAGVYLLEKDGAVHQPVSPEGALMFAVFHGPVEGLAHDGSPTGRIDCRWHIDTWRAFLAAQQTSPALP